MVEFVRDAEVNVKKIRDVLVWNLKSVVKSMKLGNRDYVS